MNKKVVLNETTDPKIKLLMDLFQPKIRTFNKQEIILNSSSDKNILGIILSGMAYLTTINLNYQKRILDYYEVYDMFCNSTLTNWGNNSYYIYAKTKCSVAFIDYREFVVENNEEILKLKSTMNDNTMRRTLQHIDILSQLTLRNKLISYFDYCRKQTQSTSFTLPISLSDLADYLAVDRSAMMRELGKMRDEKIIMSAGRKITMIEE
jgi:CRP/FNR family transcriptional regulator, anaerobic regulatory protein